MYSGYMCVTCTYIYIYIYIYVQVQRACPCPHSPSVSGPIFGAGCSAGRPFPLGPGAVRRSAGRATRIATGHSPLLGGQGRSRGLGGPP